jgi:hypothetical protein
MAELELADNLRRIIFSKRKDPQLLLAKISALQIKHGINIVATRETDVIFCAGQKDYAKATTITCKTTSTTKTGGATPEELIDAMHNQWQI